MIASFWSGIKNKESTSVCKTETNLSENSSEYDSAEQELSKFNIGDIEWLFWALYIIIPIQVGRSVVGIRFGTLTAAGTGEEYIDLLIFTVTFQEIKYVNISRYAL